jgi:hypothetical protein
MSKIIFLILQRVFWSKFIKRRIKSKLLPIAVTFIILVLAGTLLVSNYLNITFIQGLWWVWSFVEDGFMKITQLLLYA